MNKYILDTNLFFNMEAGIELGEKTEHVMKTLSRAIPSLGDEATFFMPPRIVDELLTFFDDPEPRFVRELLSLITVKSPNVSRVDFPASVFYSLVEDIRARSYRGLQVAEEEIQKAGELMVGKEPLSKKEFQMTIGSVVKKFRERYRQATRFGFLDSVADLDLIALAQEQDGYLVTTDEGVVTWGRKFGVKEMAPTVFGEKMKMVLGNEKLKM